jgi:hypothetical protein
MSGKLRFILGMIFTGLTLLFFALSRFGNAVTLAQQTESVYTYLFGLSLILSFAFTMYHGIISEKPRQKIFVLLAGLLVCTFTLGYELRETVRYSANIEFISWKNFGDHDKRRILLFEDGSVHFEISRTDIPMGFNALWTKKDNIISFDRDVYAQSKGFFSNTYIIDSSQLVITPVNRKPDSTGVMTYFPD